jgi:hypothetical protein
MVRVFLVGALALAVASFSTVSAQIIGDEGPSQLNVVRMPCIRRPNYFADQISVIQLFMVESISIYVVVLGVSTSSNVKMPC